MQTPTTSSISWVQVKEPLVSLPIEGIPHKRKSVRQEEKWK
jgi:hypothetical protein